MRAGVIAESNIPRDIVRTLGDTKSRRINTLVESIVKNSGDTIKMDSETEKYYDRLHEFLFESVYKNPIAKSEETKVSGIVEGLIKSRKNARGIFKNSSRGGCGARRYRLYCGNDRSLRRDGVFKYLYPEGVVDLRNKCEEAVL